MQRWPLIVLVGLAWGCDLTDSGNTEDFQYVAEETALKEEIRKALTTSHSEHMNGVTWFYGKWHTVEYYQVFNELFESEIDKRLTASGKQTELSIFGRPYLILHTNAVQFRLLADSFAEHAKKLESGATKTNALGPRIENIAKAEIWDVLAETMTAFTVEDTTYTRDYPYLQMHKGASQTMAASCKRIRKHFETQKTP